jgi:hypothetical protein
LIQPSALNPRDSAASLSGATVCEAGTQVSADVAEASDVGIKIVDSKIVDSKIVARSRRRHGVAIVKPPC